MNTPAPGANARRPCLLLVDDTPSNIDVLVGTLKSNYDLKVANRGAKALQICAEDDPIDLVLLDIMMPEMDGFEVCQRLRADPRTAEVPIIFITAKTAVEDAVRGFELGANDYVTKPFRPPELRARVKTHLLLRAQQREIAARNLELKETLHIVCHDVGNQFAVLGVALDLASNHPEIGIERFLPRISAATKNGIGLTRMVRELRRSEEKPLELQSVPLRPVIEEALLLAEDRLRAKELRGVTDIPDVSVQAELYSLTNSVIGNLLSNAAKFSPRGSQLDITGTVEGRTIALTVRDRGIGMPASVVATLFDVGRGRSRLGTDGERGTGFGMPLMHRFVTLYGGTVAVSSREAETHPQDHGTEFRLTLPLA